MSRSKKGDEKQNSRRWCAVCTEELTADHEGIHCKQSHHLCSDCSANYKRSIFEGGPRAFPPKCGFCASEVNLASFERQLGGTDNDGERSTFLNYMMMHQLDGDLMSSCPWCPFFCTRESNSVAEASFIFCQNPECCKVTCALCVKECVPIDDDDEEDEAVRQGMAEHFECAQKEAAFGPLRDELQRAIDRGIKPACPECNHGGIKDDACTHMTCEECHTVWCYVCGLDVESTDCDKGEGNGESEYRHNIDWFENEKRCPMYLSEISEVDPSWPEDDHLAMQKLHELSALRSIRCIYDRVGASQYRALVAAFPVLGDASGFTEEQILAVDLTQPLFIRSEPGELESVDPDQLVYAPSPPGEREGTDKDSEVASSMDEDSEEASSMDEDLEEASSMDKDSEEASPNGDLCADGSADGSGDDGSSYPDDFEDILTKFA